MRASQRGFTIVELILVIVIIGILAAVVGPRFFSKATFDNRFYFEQSLSAMRYAQKLAVASGCLVNMKIDSNGYTLQHGAGECSSAAISDPSGDSYPVAPPADVDIQQELNVTFNALGCIAGTPPTTCGSTNQVAEIGGSTVTIHAATGFIEVTL